MELRKPYEEMTFKGPVQSSIVKVQSRRKKEIFFLKLFQKEEEKIFMSSFLVSFL